MKLFSSKIFLPFAVTSLLIFPLTSSAQALDENTVATVNGEVLNLAMYQFLLGSREQDEQAGAEFALSEDDVAAIHAQAAEDLVLTEVLAQEALRLKVDQKKTNNIEITLAYKTLLAQLMVREIMANIDISEADIRSVYDAEKTTTLYRFNLWMTPSQKEAKALLAHLQNKNAFEHSYQKIETPWLDQSELDPSVVKLISATQSGAFVSQVIEQDGFWKVVQVIDKNHMEKPPFDDAKEVIKADLIQARVDAEIQRLSHQAEIQVNQELIR